MWSARPGRVGRTVRQATGGEHVHWCGCERSAARDKGWPLKERGKKSSKGQLWRSNLRTELRAGGESAPGPRACFRFARFGFLSPLCQQPREQPWRPLSRGSISRASGRPLPLRGSPQLCLHVTESFPPLPVPLITYHLPDCFLGSSQGLLFLTKGCFFSLQIPPFRV